MVNIIVYITDNVIKGWNIIQGDTVRRCITEAIRFLSFCFMYSIVPFFVSFLTILIAYFVMGTNIFQTVKVNVHSWNNVTFMVPNVTLVITLMIELFTIFAMQFGLITWIQSRNRNAQILPQLLRIHEWDIRLVNKLIILYGKSMIGTRKLIVKFYQNLYVHCIAYINIYVYLFENKQKLDNIVFDFTNK